MAYKVSDGTESGSITWSWVNGSAKQGIGIFEINLQDSVLDQHSTANTGGTPSQSLATGSTGTLGTALGFAFAFWGSESALNTQAPWTADSDFDMKSVFGLAGSVSGFSAIRHLSATTAVNPTFTTGDTGDDMWGKVAVFYASLGGGGSPFNKPFNGPFGGPF